MCRYVFKSASLVDMLTILALAGEKYEPAWESINKHPVPEWFRDAKFGIYFHWGPYSVPAFETEWYSHWMYFDADRNRRGHQVSFFQYHRATWEPQNQFGTGGLRIGI